MNEDLTLDFPIEEGNLPTLESILKEDDDLFNFEDFNSVLSFGSSETNYKIDDGTHSLTSVALPLPKININELSKPKKPRIHGSVLRHVMLKKISSQMTDACNRRDAGLPTSIAVSNLIAIGMSHGLVLVFEPRDQAMKFVLGSTADGLNYGAVTALGINVECTRLLCGYARGQVTMWDLTTGNCLRLIKDAHPVGYAVLHIHFTDDPTTSLLSDSSGSVYILSFKRLVTRTCESNCFFSGSKGEACTILPLHISSMLKNNFFHNTSLLAMATLTKLIILNLKPTPTAIFTQKLTGPSGCLPLLSWSFKISQTENGIKTVFPVLSFGRNQTILLYIVSKTEDIFCFEELPSINLNHTLVAMSWLSSQIIITIDKLECIRTIDVKTQEELECLDLGSVNLVYGSSYFKSLPTGGNVSPALKAASAHACYQSVRVFNGQLILLGTKSIHCLTMRFWKDRLDFFVKQNEYVKALQLAQLFFEGKGKAVVGLTGGIEYRRKVVGNEIINILLLYLDMAMTINCPKTSEDNSLFIYFQSLIPITIECCLLIGNLEILFNDIYERFVDDEIARNVFLEGLEHYILDDKLTYLTAIVMRDLIEHYEKSGQLEKLEKCLVHLDLSSVDINYMVKLCWNYCLYDLLIYVYNKGLKDYYTPFEKLIKLVQEALHDGTLREKHINLGNKILVYLSCCLAGNQYPLGRIDDDLVVDVKENIFNLIVKKRSDLSINSEVYPHIKTLLLFDTQEFLNVLFIAFEEKEFYTKNDSVVVSTLSKRQKVIDILLEVMLNDKSFSPIQLGYLFTFIARQMAKHENSIHVSKQLFKQVLEFLTNVDNQKGHEEREQALIELYSVGGLRQFDDEHILALAETAKFYRVCEMIYSKKKQYQNVLSCYLRDPARKPLAFLYIDEMLSDDSFTDFEKEEISVAVLNSMDKLVEVNSLKFARLILANFPSSFNKVATNLNDRPDVQFVFLKGVFQAKAEILKANKKNVINLESSVHMKFISLMCQYEPESVYRYLQSAENYDLQEVLLIVQPKKLINATAYLFERLGDVHGAFKLLCDDLRAKVQTLDDCYRGQHVDEEESEELKNAILNVGSALKDALCLCERSSRRLESDQREAIWFPLLEAVMAPQLRIVNTNSKHFLVYKEFTKDVLTNMMSFISLPAVLQKIMSDPAYSTGKFGEIKQLVLGMLDTYNYELTLLEITNSLLSKDLHGQYDQEQKFLSRGFRPSQNICTLCAREFSKDNILSDFKAILFRCGHVYHSSCLQGTVGFDEEILCVQCCKANIVRTRNRRRSEFHNLRTSTKIKVNQSKSKSEQVYLNQQQTDALNSLYNNQSSVSKLAILNEIKYQPNRNLNSNASYNANSVSRYTLNKKKNISVSDTFSLKLSPPI